MPATPIYHVGVYAKDLEATKRKFTELLGITWNDTVHFDFDITYEGKPAKLDGTVCYSIEGPPFIEVCQMLDAPGPYSTEQYREGLHHLGVWNDDADARVEELKARGLPPLMEITSITDDEKVDAGFMNPAALDGTIVEFVPRLSHLPAYTKELPGSRD